MFMAHMTRLAQADEIISGIRLFGAGKEPKRFDVVDGKAFPDVNPTVGTISTLILHYNATGNKPASAAIGSRSAYPIRGRSSLRLGCPAASRRTEARHPVLFGKPRLLTECGPAMATRQVKSCLPTMTRLASDILGAECIRGSQTCSKLVAYQVSLGCGIQECFGLPTRPARRTTKARLGCPVRLHGKGTLAGFAGLFDHSSILAQRGTMGNGTSLVTPTQAPATQQVLL